MILALNDAMPDEPEDSFEENSIGVTDFTEKLKTKYKVLKQEYMKKPTQDTWLNIQYTGLNIGTNHVSNAIKYLMDRFCNTGIDLKYGFGIYDGDKPKSMFQTLLLEIMLGNFVTKKIIEDTKTTSEGSPETTVVQYSPSPFSSDFNMPTPREDYMQSPMIVTGTTIVNPRSNTPPTITERDEKIKGKIVEIDSDNYHKVHSISKFWSLFRDHYNENCKQLQGDFKKIKAVPAFDETNTFYNQKVKNMQIIWKHVMQLKKRRYDLYCLLNNFSKNDSVSQEHPELKELPKNIDYAVNINKGRNQEEESESAKKNKRTQKCDRITDRT